MRLHHTSHSPQSHQASLSPDLRHGEFIHASAHSIPLSRIHDSPPPPLQEGADTVGCLPNSHRPAPSMTDLHFALDSDVLRDRAPSARA